jgi:hypothetical protein
MSGKVAKIIVEEPSNGAWAEKICRRSQPNHVNIPVSMTGCWGCITSSGVIFQASSPSLPIVDWGILGEWGGV